MAGLVAGAIIGGIFTGVDKYKARRSQKARASEVDLEDDQDRSSSAMGSSLAAPRSRSTSRPRHARSKSDSDVLEQALHREEGESDAEMPPPYDLETQPSYEEATRSSGAGGSSRLREDVPIDIRSRKEREEERKRRRKEFFDPRHDGNVFDLLGRSMASYHGSGCVRTKQFKYWDDDCLAQEKARQEEKKARKREAKSAARMSHGVDPPKYEDAGVGESSKSRENKGDAKKEKRRST